MSQVQLSSLSPSPYKEVHCISTEMLAQAYEVEAKQIRQNFANNKERFVEGKHFYSLSGNELREFKHNVEIFDSVKIARNVNALTLWTERGAARHAKMLNSDKAWDVFELLEETFFRVAAEHSDSTPSSAILSPAHRAELKAIVDAKLSTYPAELQGKARAELWTRFNRHFKIAEYAQLPAARIGRHAVIAAVLKGGLSLLRGACDRCRRIGDGIPARRYSDDSGQSIEEIETITPITSDKALTKTLQALE